MWQSPGLLILGPGFLEEGVTHTHFTTGLLQSTDIIDIINLVMILGPAALFRIVIGWVTASWIS